MFGISFAAPGARCAWCRIVVSIEVRPKALDTRWTGTPAETNKAVKVLGGRLAEVRFADIPKLPIE